MSESSSDSLAALAADVPQTGGLSCHRCGYDLTGLHTPRCPECGTAFDWSDPRLRAEGRPRIAFERGRTTAGRVGGFVATWLTVMFLPWVFARQAAARVRVRDGLAFAGLCFAFTPLIRLVDSGWEMWGAWMVTAAAYLPIQAGVLSLLDREFWRRPGRAFAFWVAVSGYTSAVVATECLSGPPIILLRDLLHALGGNALTPSYSAMMPQMFMWTSEAVLAWLQMGWWLTGMLCCIGFRARANGHDLSTVIVLLLAAALLLPALYGGVLETIGAQVTVWFVT